MAESSLSHSRMGFIYLLRFPNGKGYVGQTRRTVEVRFCRHAHYARKGFKGILYSGWRKHGAPTLTSIGEYPVEELNLREAQFIALYATIAPSGYNLASGGGVPLSTHEATRAKLSAARKGIPQLWNEGKPKALAHRARISAALLGHAPTSAGPITAAHRAKISTALKGKPLSAETRAKLSAVNMGRPPNATSFKKGQSASPATTFRVGRRPWNKGRPQTEEVRMKLSIAHKGQAAWNKGRTHSAETRARISEAKRGKKLPPRTAEHCAKISAAKRLQLTKSRLI